MSELEKYGIWVTDEMPGWVGVKYRHDDETVFVIDTKSNYPGPGVFRREHNPRLEAHEVWGEHGRFARLYFDAHPPRKPWEDAQEGEYWMIKTIFGPDYYLSEIGAYKGKLIFQLLSPRTTRYLAQVVDAYKVELDLSDPRKL